MAVIQISRIQIRRGKKNEGSGFPQLASGELGWAIDTQELYIGNGAVSEGAPAVGNTKILTDKDLFVDNTMLALVRHQYRYPDIQTGPSFNSPVTRTLQERLDDRVTAASFGADGNYDGVALTGIDNTIPLQRAINQLFLNPSNTEAYNNTVDGIKSRVILELPAGRYKIVSGLKIPSYATLVGAGPDKTIIELVSRSLIVSITQNNKTINSINATADMVNCTIEGAGIPEGTIISSVIPGTSFQLSNFPTATNVSTTVTISYNGPIVQFINDSSTPSSINPDATIGITQPKNIILKGFTLRTSIQGIAGLSIESVKNSVFEDLNVTGNAINILNTSSIGISMSVETDIVTCEKNHFNRINIFGFTYGIYAQEDIINNTFSNFMISNTTIGISFGEDIQNQIGQKYGPRNNHIIDSKFSRIAQSAIVIESGYGNVVENITLENVGNNLGNFESVTYPQIYVQAQNNIVRTIAADRSSVLGDPLYRVKIVRMDLNRSITASAGAYVLQMDNALVVAEGYLRADVSTATEIELIVADDNQIFNTTNDLVIENDSTPSDSNLSVRPTNVDDIAEISLFVPYIPEVAGRCEYHSQGTRRVRVSPVNLFVRSNLIKLPVNTNKFGVSDGVISYSINYVYTSNNGFVRRGTFNVICNEATKYASLTDEYDYLNTSTTSADTDEAVKLAFYAKLVDVDGTNVTGASTGPYSIIVEYTNSLTADEGYLVYSYNSIFS